MDQNDLRLDKAAGKTIKRKVTFRTTGRDRCLAEGFIVKTLAPDTDAMNDASPDDVQNKEDSKGAPVPINDVPELPENMDEELAQPTTRCDSEEFLKKHRGRRQKIDSRGVIATMEA